MGKIARVIAAWRTGEGMVPEPLDFSSMRVVLDDNRTFTPVLVRTPDVEGVEQWTAYGPTSVGYFVKVSITGMPEVFGRARLHLALLQHVSGKLLFAPIPADMSNHIPLKKKDVDVFSTYLRGQGF